MCHHDVFCYLRTILYPRSQETLSQESQIRTAGEKLKKKFKKSGVTCFSSSDIRKEKKESVRANRMNSDQPAKYGTLRYFF